MHQATAQRVRFTTRPNRGGGGGHPHPRTCSMSLLFSLGREPCLTHTHTHTHARTHAHSGERKGRETLELKQINNVMSVSRRNAMLAAQCSI